jgi:hypothetical protein
MSRRADPARIYIARREATAARLRSAGLPPETVGASLDAREGTDPDPMAAEYRTRGLAWIEGEVVARRKPPTTG